MSLLQEPGGGFVFSHAGTESRGTSRMPNNGEVWGGCRVNFMVLELKELLVYLKALLVVKKYHDEKGHSVLGGLTQKHGEEAPGTTSQRK